LQPICLFLIHLLIFELYSKAVQKTKIKWCFVYFWRMGIVFIKNKKFFTINPLLLLFVRFVVLFVWLLIIVLMAKYLI
jgi:hypothetical protein